MNLYRGFLGRGYEFKVKIGEFVFKKEVKLLRKMDYIYRDCCLV